MIFWCLVEKRSSDYCFFPPSGGYPPLGGALVALPMSHQVEDILHSVANILQTPVKQVLSCKTPVNLPGPAPVKHGLSCKRRLNRVYPAPVKHWFVLQTPDILQTPVKH